MGNYAPVQVEIWNHPKFQRLANHPLGDLRLAAMYCLTNPYRSYLTGFFRLKLPDITDHLGGADDRAAAVIEALTATNWVRYDYENKVLLVLDHLEHNQIGGHRQITSVVDHVKTLRHSPLLWEFIAASRRYAHKCPGLYEALIAVFGEPTGESVAAPISLPPHLPAVPPERDTVPPSPRPADDADQTEALRQLGFTHEKHSCRTLNPNDHADLKKALQDAAAAGVDWQTLQRLMTQAQREYEPTAMKPRIERVSYYFRVWDPHIREALEEQERRGPPGRQPPHLAEDSYRRPLSTDSIE